MTDRTAVLGGGGRLTNDESFTLSIAGGFAAQWFQCDVIVISDSGWISAQQQLGTPISYNRTRVYGLT